MKGAELLVYSGLLAAVFLLFGLGIGHWLGFRTGRDKGQAEAISALLKERRDLERRKAIIDRALAPRSSTRAAVIAPTASLRSQAQVDDKSR